MKKIKIILSSIGASLLPAIALAYPAVDSLDMCGVIRGIENAIWMIFGAIAVIMFVISGILLMTAQGDPEKVQKARGSFMWGIAGVIVGIIAFSIMAIVGTAIGVGAVGTGC